MLKHVILISSADVLLPPGGLDSLAFRKGELSFVKSLHDWLKMSPIIFWPRTQAQHLVGRPISLFYKCVMSL